MVAEGTNDLSGNDGGETPEKPGSNSHAEMDERGLAGLSVPKRNAMQGLLSGKSVSESAKLAGIGRVTIYRWLKTDPTFAAAYNEWQGQIEQACRARLLMLTEKAMDAVAKALEAGDAKLGLQLLKGMGVLKPTPIGPTDAEEMRKVMDKQKKRSDRDLDMFM